MLGLRSSNQTLGPGLRAAIAATAVIDLLIGMAFLLGAIFWAYERASMLRQGLQAPAMSGGQSQ